MFAFEKLTLPLEILGSIFRIQLCHHRNKLHYKSINCSNISQCYSFIVFLSVPFNFHCMEKCSSGILQNVSFRSLDQDEMVDSKWWLHILGSELFL